MGTSRSDWPMTRRLYSCREAAKILDVSDDTVRRLIQSGTLDAVRIGKRILRVFGESLERCIHTSCGTNRLTVLGEATWSVGAQARQAVQDAGCEAVESSKGGVS